MTDTELIYDHLGYYIQKYKHKQEKPPSFISLDLPSANIALQQNIRVEHGKTNIILPVAISTMDLANLVRQLSC